MLNSRDNSSTDAPTAPRRNIFAPPTASASREAAPAGGVFDATAACRGRAPVGDVVPRGRTASSRKTVRPAGFGRRLTGLLAGLTAAVALGALLAAPARQEVPRHASSRDRIQAAPADVQAVRTLHKPRGKAPKAASGRTRRRSPRARRHTPRAARPLEAAAPPPPVVPQPRPAAPPQPVAPQPPAAAPMPARVPAGSLPEFP
jgi:hypothetical protein